MLIVEQDESTSVIVVKGALDPFAATALSAEITDAEGCIGKRVIVSLERCSRLGDVALGVLAEAKAHLKSRLLVVAPRGERTRKRLETRGLVENLALFKSIREARDAASFA
ncbi:MAG: hypothetical protein NVSMB21_12250 [Vulcanimicrobiaceae bacterium]